MGCTDSRSIKIAPAAENVPKDDGNQQKIFQLTLTSPREFAADFPQVALQAHNDYRVSHKVAPLSLSIDLCNMAQRLVNNLAETRTFVSSTPEERIYKEGECGENIYRFSAGPEEFPSAEMVVESWYSEVEDYHTEIPGYDITTCHFTQLVWKATQELGIAFAHYDDDDGSRKYLVVATYFPTGNVEGAYQENVLVPDDIFE